MQLDARSVIDGSVAGEDWLLIAAPLPRHLYCSQHLPWNVLLVAERFAPIVARVVTNAKRCLPWSRLFPFPEDGLIYDLSQWDHLARL